MTSRTERVDKATKRCHHGPAIPKAGVAKSYQAYAGWFCPLDLCQPYYESPQVFRPFLDDWLEHARNASGPFIPERPDDGSTTAQ